MPKGDIIFTLYPFTDLIGVKLRPAVVLIEMEKDITASFITTQIQWKDPNDLELEPTINNGLKKTSIVRLSKIATINKSLIRGKLGLLTSEEIIELNQKLIKVFQLL